MAKASAGGATHYVAEGDPVPDDLPPGVRLVGPGAPVAEAEAEDVPGPTPQDEAAEGHVHPGYGVPMGGIERPPDGTMSEISISGDGEDEGPPDYMAYRVTDLRELARDRGLPVAGAKPDLAAALAQWDADHPDGMATGGVVDPDVALRVGE